MPINDEFNPDLISRYDEGLIRFINENFLAIKRVFNKVALETISTIPPSSPYDGQKYIDTTNDIEYIYDAGTSNWLAINQWGAWTDLSSSPVTILQNVSVAYSSTYLRYSKEGRKVHYQGYVTFSAAGTANNAIRVGLPASAGVAGSRAVGSGYYSNTVVNCPVVCFLDATSTFQMIATDTSSALVLGQTGGGPNGGNATLANNHRLTWDITYESAS